MVDNRANRVVDGGPSVSRKSGLMGPTCKNPNVRDWPKADTEATVYCTINAVVGDSRKSVAIKNVQIGHDPGGIESGKEHQTG